MLRNAQSARLLAVGPWPSLVPRFTSSASYKPTQCRPPPPLHSVRRHLFTTSSHYRQSRDPAQEEIYQNNLGDLISSRLAESGIATINPSSLPTTLRRTMRQIPYPVAIVTCGPVEDKLGVTISSFNSISLDPPMITFNIRFPSSTGEYILKHKEFHVTLLSSEPDTNAQAAAILFASPNDDDAVVGSKAEERHAYDPDTLEEHRLEDDSSTNDIRKRDVLSDTDGKGAIVTWKERHTTFECTLAEAIDVANTDGHKIIVGVVQGITSSVEAGDGEGRIPLLYRKRKYWLPRPQIRELGPLEEDAVEVLEDEDDHPFAEKEQKALEAETFMKNVYKDLINLEEGEEKTEEHPVDRVAKMLFEAEQDEMDSSKVETSPDCDIDLAIKAINIRKEYSQDSSTTPERYTNERSSNRWDNGRDQYNHTTERRNNYSARDSSDIFAGERRGREGDNGPDDSGDYRNSRGPRRTGRGRDRGGSARGRGGRGHSGSASAYEGGRGRGRSDGGYENAFGIADRRGGSGGGEYKPRGRGGFGGDRDGGYQPRERGGFNGDRDGGDRESSFNSSRGRDRGDGEYTLRGSAGSGDRNFGDGESSYVKRDQGDREYVPRGRGRGSFRSNRDGGNGESSFGSSSGSGRGRGDGTYGGRDQGSRGRGRGDGDSREGGQGRSDSRGRGRGRF